MNGEAAAAKVERILRDGALMVRENLHEAIDVTARGGHAEIESLERIFYGIVGGAITVIETDDEKMWRAIEIRKAFYSAKLCDISRPDALLIATAETIGARIATADKAVIEVANALRIKIARLPIGSG